MRRYESIVVFNPNLGEADVKEEIKKIQGILEGNAAQEIAVDMWGKREIAYLIGRNKYGFYVQFNYVSDNNEVVNELSSLLRINERVMKFQNHRINDRVRKFKGNPKRKPSSDSEGDDFIIDGDF